MSSYVTFYHYELPIVSPTNSPSRLVIPGQTLTGPERKLFTEFFLANATGSFGRPSSCQRQLPRIGTSWGPGGWELMGIVMDLSSRFFVKWSHFVDSSRWQVVSDCTINALCCVRLTCAQDIIGRIQGTTSIKIWTHGGIRCCTRLFNYI